MKKDVLKILFIVILLFGLCGCTKKDLNDKKDNQLFGDFKEKINCPELKNIKISNPRNYPEDESNGGFLTDSGEYYYFGNFSDGTNCKKLEIEKEIVKFSTTDNLYLFDQDNKIYRYDSKKLEETEIVSYEWRSLDLYMNSNAIKNHYGPLNVSAHYILEKDGIIYLLNIEKKELDKISFAGEKILDFSVKKYELHWIKTDKAHYLRKVKDKKCYQYDDIECEYEYVKNDVLTSHYEDIAFIEEDIVVLKDGNSYYLNN